MSASAIADYAQKCLLALARALTRFIATQGEQEYEYEHEIGHRTSEG